MLFEVLNRRIQNLSPDVKREFKKMYVAYKLDTNFVDIVFQKQRLRIPLNMKFFEVIDPNAICRDITGLDRWGNGDVELYMEHTSDVDQIMDFLELFLRTLLLNETHPLHNRTLHISGTLKAAEKVNIENKKSEH